MQPASLLQSHLDLIWTLQMGRGPLENGPERQINNSAANWLNGISFPKVVVISFLARFSCYAARPPR